MVRFSHSIGGLSYGIAMFAIVSAVADDWPQWQGPTRDGLWRETGIVEKFPKEGPKILWRVPIEGGYAGPAVASGKVFVTDYVGQGDKSPSPDKKNNLKGEERVHCLDAVSGKSLWTRSYPCEYNISYPCGPRTTPVVDGDRLYTLGAEGNLLCLNAGDGNVVWMRDLKKDYKTQAPHWGFSSHPLVVGDKLYCVVGGEGSIAVAFDKTTGKELWRSLSAKDAGYSPPTMIEAGGVKQLLIWHPEAINGLDPETGKVYWSTPLEPMYGMSIMGPRKAGEYLFASGIGDKGVLLKLAGDKPAVEVVWHGKNDTAVYCVCSTPIIDNGTIYGVDQKGQLRGVDLKTGKRLWETFAPTTGSRRADSGTAFPVKNGDRYFLMSETGNLVIARLTPERYEELSRFQLLEPTGDAFGRKVVWSHPAFANRNVYARNDKEIVCASLAAE